MGVCNDFASAFARASAKDLGRRQHQIKSEIARIIGGEVGQYGESGNVLDQRLRIDYVRIVRRVVELKVVSPIMMEQTRCGYRRCAPSTFVQRPRAKNYPCSSSRRRVRRPRQESETGTSLPSVMVTRTEPERR